MEAHRGLGCRKMPRWRPAMQMLGAPDAPVVPELSEDDEATWRCTTSLVVLTALLRRPPSVGAVLLKAAWLR